MGVKLCIAGIEAGPAARHSLVAHLCRAAGIAQTSWVRWKNGADASESSWKRIEDAYLAVIGRADAPVSDAA